LLGEPSYEKQIETQESPNEKIEGFLAQSNSSGKTVEEIAKTQWLMGG